MPAVKDKLKVLDDAIEQGTKDAQAKWGEYEDLKRQVLENDDVDPLGDDDVFDKVHEAHRAYGEKADEVDKLKSRRESLWAMEGERGSSGPKPLREARERIKEGMHSRTYGDRITASEEYKALVASGALDSSSDLGRVRLGQLMDRDELYAVMMGGRQASVVVTDPAGDDTVAPFMEPEHRGLIEPRFRPLLIRDLITVGTTDRDSIDYVLETGWVNNAAFVPEAQTDAPIDGTEVTAAEGGRKPQSRISYEKRSNPIQTMAHWVASTKKSLSDVPRLRTTIDARLRHGLDDKTEDQIIQGDGTGENLTGILNTSGVQHQEASANQLEDILKAMTKVELAHFRVTATGINSLDWQNLRLVREDGATGAYMFGPPSQAGASTLWGRPVVTGPQFPQGQPVVGEWRTAEFLIREGITVVATDSHEDFFVRNLVAILAEYRGGLVVPQPEAFCEVSDSTP